MRSIGYHQFCRNCISSTSLEVVYHQGDSFLCTPKGVMRYKCDLSHLMIYTLLRDDIPSLSAWIKKTLVFLNESFLSFVSEKELV